MNAYIQKWGNSLAVRIPSKLIKKLNLANGTSVELSAKNHHLIISPIKSELDTLLESINSSNRHPEGLEDDTLKGAEEW